MIPTGNDILQQNCNGGPAMPHARETPKSGDCFAIPSQSPMLFKIKAAAHVLISGLCMLANLPTRRKLGSRILGLVGIALVMSVCAGPVAQAGTATGTLPVTMTITASCTIGATAMAFTAQLGAGLTSTAATATGSITVTCTNQAPYAIGLDNGANYSTTRRMIFSSNYLPYGLYTNVGLTTPWSTATSSAACTTSSNCYTGTGSGAAQVISVYGQVPTIGTAPPPGNYSDTVNITVYY